mmetsp:Transcript_113940/g.322573  ORF Transcript_113940/g.322573 Transcript_113940/m.322573 type:complete len:267 (-) Transcript_113940:92-892(-)
MGRGRRDEEDDRDVGDDPKKWDKAREKAAKEKQEKKARRERDERSDRPEEHKGKGEAHEFKPGEKVMVTGLVKNPEKNGSIGKLVEFVQAKERWAVLFDSSMIHNFKVENLKFVKEGGPAAEDEGDTGDIPTPKVYVTNLPGSTTEDDLMALFSGIGVIAKVPVRNSKGNTKGFPDQWPPAVKLYKPGRDGGDACVEFEDRSSARAAIKTFQGHVLKGMKLGVEYAGQGSKNARGNSSQHRGGDRDRSRSRERLRALEEVKGRLNG